jgi:hypothetical protein
VRESKKSNKSSKKPPGIYENSQFPALIDLKIAENYIFLN